MRFVATKTTDQLDLQALHRVRERLVGQRTGIINQTRAFLLERGARCDRGFASCQQNCRASSPPDRTCYRHAWSSTKTFLESLPTDIKALADQDPACERLMSVPGIGPIISSAMVAAIGNGAAFSKGRDFGAWLGLVPRQMSLEIARSSSRSRSRAIDICASCSCRPLGSCW